MPRYWHPDTDQFRKWGLEPPKATEHGTEAEIEGQRIAMKPHKWELQGNQLIGYSEAGRIVQTIPSDYICLGTDEAGKPILKKVQPR